MSLQEAAAVSGDDGVEFHVLRLFLRVIADLGPAAGTQPVHVILQAQHFLADASLVRAVLGQVFDTRLLHLPSKMPLLIN